MHVQKVLHLNLKKKWYEMIASGEKTEEYREIKKYWTDRFFLCHQGSIIPQPKIYHVVVFRNGYRNAPQMAFEIRNIYIGGGKGQWGADSGKWYYVISLGKKLTQVRDLIKTNTSNVDLWVWEPK